MNNVYGTVNVPEFNHNFTIALLRRLSSKSRGCILKCGYVGLIFIVSAMRDPLRVHRYNFLVQAERRYRHLELNNVGLLLSDCGYPLRHYLMTPVLRPQGRQQTTYNAHARGMVVAERAFGLLKSRF
ncbi:hypothetical protein MAR_025940, partial [Mya arenaria]